MMSRSGAGGDSPLEPHHLHTGSSPPYPHGREGGVGSGGGVNQRRNIHKGYPLRKTSLYNSSLLLLCILFMSYRVFFLHHIPLGINARLYRVEE